MLRALAFVALALTLFGCNDPSSAPIRAEPAPTASSTADAGGDGDAGLRDAATPDASDAHPDSDACVPGEEWEARLVVTHVKTPIPMQGSLELVVPRLGKRVVVYRNCGATGGGCGDCSKPAWDGISCVMDSSHARVDVGIDDMGPTFVDVRQRGDAIVANWTWGKLQPDWDEPAEGTKETKVLLRLPCAVKIRFVR